MPPEVARALHWKHPTPWGKQERSLDSRRKKCVVLTQEAAHPRAPRAPWSTQSFPNLWLAKGGPWAQAGRKLFCYMERPGDPETGA